MSEQPADQPVPDNEPEQTGQPQDQAQQQDWERQRELEQEQGQEVVSVPGTKPGDPAAGQPPGAAVPEHGWQQPISSEDTVTVERTGPGQSQDTGQPRGFEAQHARTEGGALAPENTASPLQGTANESPVLPPNAQAGAAKAHAFLGHLVTVAQQAQAEIERYVPAELINAAETEAGAFIRSIL